MKTVQYNMTRAYWAWILWRLESIGWSPLTLNWNKIDWLTVRIPAKIQPHLQSLSLSGSQYSQFLHSITLYQTKFLHELLMEAVPWTSKLKMSYLPITYQWLLLIYCSWNIISYIPCLCLLQTITYLSDVWPILTSQLVVCIAESQTGFEIVNLMESQTDYQASTYPIASL